MIESRCVKISSDQITHDRTQALGILDELGLCDIEQRRTATNFLLHCMIGQGTNIGRLQGPQHVLWVGERQCLLYEVPCEEAAATGEAQELLERIARNVDASNGIGPRMCRRHLEDINVRGLLGIASRMAPIQKKGCEWRPYYPHDLSYLVSGKHGGLQLQLQAHTRRGQAKPQR